MCRYVGAPPPLNESMRLQTLQAMGILDSAPEKKYEEVTKLLQHLFQAGSCTEAQSGAYPHWQHWATDWSHLSISCITAVHFGLPGRFCMGPRLELCSCRCPLQQLQLWTSPAFGSSQSRAWDAAA